MDRPAVSDGASPAPSLNPSVVLAVCVLSLLALGIVMVQSAAMNVTGNTSWHWSPRGTQHLAFAGIALATFLVVGVMDYRGLRRDGLLRSPTTWLLGLALLACLLVLVPGIGKEVNGARRWLPLGFTQVQPSELGKWAAVLFLAWWVSRPATRIAGFFRGLVPGLLVCGAVCLLVVAQDFGTAALIGGCGLLILLAGGVRMWQLMLVVPPLAAAAIWFIRHKEYRWRRMVAFLDPFADPRGEGYHMVQTLLSYASGGLFGRGLGNGIQKLGYLPEDTTDFIFAVICEELGIFGAALVIGLYLGILWSAWRIAVRCADPFGRVLAFGIGAMIGLQALINISVATVSVPPKGLSLPLVSAGGSGLVITCAALGLLLSVARRGQIATRTPPAADQPEHAAVPPSATTLQAGM